jgi:hypothetical protein
MNKILLVTILLLLPTSCSPSEPEFVDNGQPGQIKVLVFLDTNRNGTRESDETSLQEQVGLSQDVSCPAQSRELVTFLTPNSNGEAIYEALEPGKYCISYHGEMLPTTKLAFEVILSSDQELVAYLGLMDN